MNHFTIADLIRKPPTAGSVSAARIAVTFHDHHVTYDELHDRSSRLASALAARGFAKGDRVGVLLHNRVEWVEVFFAVAQLGGVIVPLNYLLKPKEIGYILDDCAAAWMIYENALRELVRDDAPPRGRTHIGIDIGDEYDDVEYEQLLSSGDGRVPVAQEVHADDLFLLQYTSGTTGAPKGAMHSHSTVLWNSFHQIVDYRVTHDDVFLVVPALCWAAGFHDLALATLWMGGRIVLNPSTGFTPANLLATIEREKVTSALLVPTVLKRVLAEPSFDDHDLSSLRLIYSGGEPVPVTSIEHAHRKLPSCSVLQVYGMSEFPTMMLYLDATYAVTKAGSTGRACSAAQIRIVDRDGHDAPPGVIGEIICRSPANMVGYYRNPEATSRTLRDGWLHTGDLAHADADGFVSIAGRGKDMIITGGLNVYPAEVERVIAQHPAVVEAAVVGVSDSDWGEVGKALVVLQPDTNITTDELVGFLKRELGSYKIPRQFSFTHEALPRTTSGKVQKFRVKERLGL